MEPIKFTPSKGKFILLLMLSLVFVTIGFLSYNNLEDNTGPWVIILFFGIGAVVSLLQLVPGVSWLLLDKDGFTTCNLYRKNHFLWKDIKEFGIIKSRGNEVLAFSFNPGFDQSRTGWKISKALMGFECAIPNVYKLEVEELKKIMEKYKDPLINQWKQTMVRSAFELFLYKFSSFFFSRRNQLLEI